MTYYRCRKGLVFFFIGFYIGFDPPEEGTNPDAAGYVTLVAIYIFAAVYQFDYGLAVWIYCSVRSTSLPGNSF
jgi:hypothetical protein